MGGCLSKLCGSATTAPDPQPVRRPGRPAGNERPLQTVPRLTLPPAVPLPLLPERSARLGPAAARLVRTPNTPFLARAVAGIEARDAKWSDHPHRADTEESLFERLMERSRLEVAQLPGIPLETVHEVPVSPASALAGIEDAPQDSEARGYLEIMTRSPRDVAASFDSEPADQLLAFALYARFQEEGVRRGIYARLLGSTTDDEQLRTGLGTLCRLLAVGGGIAALHDLFPELRKELLAAALALGDAGKAAAAIRVVKALRADFEGAPRAGD